jgi:hypothetical protein
LTIRRYQFQLTVLFTSIVLIASGLGVGHQGLARHSVTLFASSAFLITVGICLPLVRLAGRTTFGSMCLSALIGVVVGILVWVLFYVSPSHRRPDSLWEPIRRLRREGGEVWRDLDTRQLVIDITTWRSDDESLDELVAPLPTDSGMVLHLNQTQLHLVESSTALHGIRRSQIVIHGGHIPPIEMSRLRRLLPDWQLATEATEVPRKGDTKRDEGG